MRENAIIILGSMSLDLVTAGGLKDGPAAEDLGRLMAVLLAIIRAFPRASKFFSA